MTGPAIIAFGAVDALGEGEAALAGGNVTAVARDPELELAKLLRPVCARARVSGDGDRASLLLARALADCLRGLDLAGKRVGLALGTSSGGLRSLEERLGLAGTYLGPLLGVPRPLAFEPFSLVLGACASSTLAIGIARAWLEEDLCDVALAGGFDAVSVFVAAGFEALRATTATAPRPFRIGRDGLALGEGAAIVAMVRPRDLTTEPLAYVTGFGASCDAVHLTAPDRTGAGLARAAEAAYGEAGRPVVGLVSAHGTATEYNDAAEAKAIAAVLGGGGDPVPVHAFKGAVGHTLGAAGALETLAAIQALRKGEVPASCGEGELEPGVRVIASPEPLASRVALKLSSAFGGANAALVLETQPRASADPTRAPRPVYVSRAVAIHRAPDARALAERTGVPEDKIARGDRLVHLAMGAVAELPLPIRGAGVIVGMGLASLETNCVYLARIRAMGATRAEPRRFPYTTPNAAAGECAVAFGLTGPAFAVGGGPHGGIEALMVARDLVACGAADRIVVVAADEVGDATRTIAPETREGAVALVVAAEPLAARLDAVTVRLGVGPLAAAPAMDAHGALLPLCHEDGARPETISVDLPWGGFANARLFWL